MHSNSRWTRRQLLKIGALSVGARLASHDAEASLPGLHEQSSNHQDSYVYLASRGLAAEEQGVHVFRVHHHCWEPLQFVPSAAPSSLTISPNGETLFVTNCVDLYKNLPMGSVESWRMDRKTGRLSLLSRQGLALTAIHPSHAAVSHDGSKLAVSAANGSSCVILPVREEGDLGEPAAVRKELRPATHGSPLVSAAQLCFAPNGQLVIADFSQGFLSIYACASSWLERGQRLPLPETSTSVTFLKQAHGLEIRLLDGAQQELAAFSYTGKLNESQAGVGSPQRALDWLRTSSFQRATFIHAAADYGSCLIKRKPLAGLEPPLSQALAWLHV